MNKKVSKNQVTLLAILIVPMILIMSQFARAESLTVQPTASKPASTDEILVCEFSVESEEMKRKVLSTIYTDTSFKLLEEKRSMGAPTVYDCNGQYRIGFSRTFNNLDQNKIRWHINVVYRFHNYFLASKGKETIHEDSGSGNVEDLVRGLKSGRTVIGERWHIWSRSVPNGYMMSLDCEVKANARRFLLEQMNKLTSPENIDPTKNNACPAVSE